MTEKPVKPLHAYAIDPAAQTFTLIIPADESEKAVYSMLQQCIGNEMLRMTLLQTGDCVYYGDDSTSRTVPVATFSLSVFPGHEQIFANTAVLIGLKADRFSPPTMTIEQVSAVIAWGPRDGLLHPMGS